MKHVSVYTVFLAFTFSSCSLFTRDENIPRMFEGTFVKTIEQEYATGMDTLIIMKDNTLQYGYMVKRIASFQQRIDGKDFSPKVETHHYKAVYNADKKCLEISNKEFDIVLSEDGNSIEMGTSEYKKVK